MPRHMTSADRVRMREASREHRAEKRKRKMAGTFVRDGKQGRPEYKTRALILKAMGFGSYRDYLSSELWRSIRNRVLTHVGRTCAYCNTTEAEAVHHGYYTPENMAGINLLHLYPICSSCHEDIEHMEQRKIGCHSVRKRAARLIEARLRRLTIDRIKKIVEQFKPNRARSA